MALNWIEDDSAVDICVERSRCTAQYDRVNGYSYTDACGYSAVAVNNPRLVPPRCSCDVDAVIYRIPILGSTAHLEIVQLESVFLGARNYAFALLRCVRIRLGLQISQIAIYSTDYGDWMRS